MGIHCQSLHCHLQIIWRKALHAIWPMVLGDCGWRQEDQIRVRDILVFKV
jgi:hypothetical protein